MRVFVDMDGVLADYYAGVWRAFAPGVDPWPFKCRVGDWDFFHGEPLNLTNELVAPRMDREFYAGLSVFPDAATILTEAVRVAGTASRVFLLSSPWDTPGCDEGKREWVRLHLPTYTKRTLIGNCKEACAHSGAVLFDDSEVNCRKFTDAGGYACVVPRPWNNGHRECDHATGTVGDVRQALGAHRWMS